MISEKGWGVVFEPEPRLWTEGDIEFSTSELSAFVAALEASGADLKQQAELLLSRLPLADQLELLRGVLPEVSRHHFPESDYEREFVEFDLNSQVIQVVKPWNDVDPDLGQPSDREDLLSVAAVCLAAAAELGGCDE